MNINKRVKLPLHTYIVVIEYSKPFKSIFKTLVYTKTINNDAHGYTRP